MKRFLLGLSLVFAGIASWAIAQDITNHAVPIGGGPGAVGWKTAGPCSAGQALVWSGTNADPTCISVSGSGSTPGGANGNIQYNNAGTFGGLTDTQVTARINAFTSSLSGAAPASGGGTTNFLRADGSWAAPTGNQISVARVDNNGVDIVYAPPGSGGANNYIRYSPSTARANQDSYWKTVCTLASFCLQPPTGARAVQLTGQTYISAGAAASGVFANKWIKNYVVDGSGFLISGSDVCAGPGVITQGIVGSMLEAVTCFDVPTGTDYYGLFVFADANGGGLITINGNPAHTFLSTAVFH